VFLAGWGALLLYAGACSPLGLEAAVLVGSFDCAHRVNMCAGTQGPQLVLHHDRICAAHRHGLAARALVVFARPASATNPDHVLQFRASDNRRQSSQLTAPRPANVEQSDFALVETVLSCARESLSPSAPVHPPPDEQEQRLCLRSTVLLI